MITAAVYAALARMLDYPEETQVLLSAHNVVCSFLEEDPRKGPLAAFAKAVETMSLASLQEEYVAMFDFNPATAPYLGHHLFGDNQKKAAYLVELRSEYRRHGFLPTSQEPPDHLPVVLDFLAHCAGREATKARQDFLSRALLPGLERLDTALTARPASPWGVVIEAALRLCAEDCKETAPC